MTLSGVLNPELAHALKTASGVDFSGAAAQAARGGSINRCAVLHTTDGRPYFLKLNAPGALTAFEAEADGLHALAACDAFRIPRPLAWGSTADEAFLLLEYLDLRPVSSPEDGRRFALALAVLHRDACGPFGWPRDNFIGATPQANTPEEGWARFFVNHRLRPQLRLAREKGYGTAIGREIEEALERVPALFLEYRPRPSLLHGDLWHGNAAVSPDGTPVLFDPAVYRGDRETDIAMTELFGGFPTAFYAAYRTANPLADGYEERKTLYSLYHVLNHLNLFGRAYLGQVERMIRSVVATLRR